jgi:putative cell wall-binding protein
VGGASVVPESVRETLEASGYKVERLAGPTRYETAVRVAEKMGSPSEAFVAVGTNFPDALCASPPAANLGAPVLFSNQSGALTAQVRSYLQGNPSIDQAYIVGDETVVPATVEQELAGIVGDVERLGGDTRYDTCLEITEHFYGDTMNGIGLASGADFPDALTGSVLCAEAKAPLMLTLPDQLVWHVPSYLDDRRPPMAWVYGGPGAVSESVVDEMAAGW